MENINSYFKSKPELVKATVLYFKTISLGIIGGVLAGLFWYWFAILTTISVSLFGIIFGFAVSGMMTISLRHYRHIIYRISSLVITFFSYLYTEYLLNREIFSTSQYIDISYFPTFPTPYELALFSYHFYWGATVVGLLLALVPAWKNLGELNPYD